jgi:hypothetical protein
MQPMFASRTPRSSRSWHFDYRSVTLVAGATVQLPRNEQKVGSLSEQKFSRLLCLCGSTAAQLSSFRNMNVIVLAGASAYEALTTFKPFFNRL